MSIEVKPGRWRLRNGFEAVVLHNTGVLPWSWRGCYAGYTASWSADGVFGMAVGPFDLVEYLGPEEPQATS